jgi:hypothetical protein
MDRTVECKKEGHISRGAAGRNVTWQGRIAGVCDIRLGAYKLGRQKGDIEIAT